jgi:hypothetical protein
MKQSYRCSLQFECAIGLDYAEINTMECMDRNPKPEHSASNLHSVDFSNSWQNRPIFDTQDKLLSFLSSCSFYNATVATNEQFWSVNKV